MSKKLKIGIVMLLVVACIVAVIHINSQEEIPCMVIRNADQEVSVSYEDLRPVCGNPGDHFLIIPMCFSSSIR